MISIFNLPPYPHIWGVKNGEKGNGQVTADVTETLPFGSKNGAAVTSGNVSVTLDVTDFRPFCRVNRPPVTAVTR